MPRQPLRLLRADGTPAADALVSVAQAPQPVPDLGLVADGDGRLVLDAAVAGPHVLSVWVDGHAHTLALRIDDAPRPLELRLPG